MISFFITIVLSVIVLLLFVLKLCKVDFVKRVDFAICVIIPILCIVMFIALFFEISYRKRAEGRELDILNNYLVYTINNTRVFINNEDKKECIDSLKNHLILVNAIAREDSLLSIISGKDEEMTMRILQCKTAIEEHIVWINRLNNFLDSTLTYTKSFDARSNIILIGPSTDELPVLNIAFKLSGKDSEILCTHIEVVRDDTIIYERSFIYNPPINCFAIPYNKSSYDIVRIGYIGKENNENVFKYITYANK